MAIVKSTLGKFSGRLGNFLLYEGRDGQTLCRSVGVMPNRQTEKQKQHCAAFGTMVQTGRFLLEIIRMGFPGEKRYPAGMQGFIRANINTAVKVNEIKPGNKMSAQKQVKTKFQGVIDFEQLQVSGGSLGTPEGVTAIVNAETQTVRFIRQEMGLESPCRFRDDELYGAVVCRKKWLRCQVFPLGVRGKADDRSIKITSKHFHLETAAVYVFAKSADGKKASPSVCLLA